MRSFFLQLLLTYAVVLTIVSIATVEILVFITKLYQAFNNRLIRETQWLLDEYKKTHNVIRSKE
jgi:hypothetical protein